MTGGTNVENYNKVPTPIEVEYRILDDNARLYDQEEFHGTTKIVKAQYAKSAVYPGNPLVEALAAPRSAHQIFLNSQKEMREFNYKEMIRKPMSRRIEHLIALRDLHYVLPSQPILENAFHMSLVSSYGHRAFMESNTKDLEIVIKDEKSNTNRILVGNADDSAFGGFSLIGPSGCGKSTEIRYLLDNEPQVIIHKHKDGSTSVQLVYIVVNCPARSNFRALLQAIGMAIDRALGNICPVYEKLLSTKSRDNLGVAFLQLRRVIEHLSIGMIMPVCFTPFLKAKHGSIIFQDQVVDNGKHLAVTVGKALFQVSGNSQLNSNLFQQIGCSVVEPSGVNCRNRAALANSSN